MDLPIEIREAMIAHARFCLPDEACGLLAADRLGNLRMVYNLTNVERSPTRFTVDPTEHMRAWRHAEANGWTLAGAFHSHVNTAAIPSRTDIARALEPAWLWVIVSLASRDQPDVRGYWIRDGRVTEEPLEVRTVAASGHTDSAHGSMGAQTSAGDPV